MGHGTGAVLHVELEGEQGIRSCIYLIRPELDSKAPQRPSASSTTASISLLSPSR